MNCINVCLQENNDNVMLAPQFTQDNKDNVMLAEDDKGHEDFIRKVVLNTLWSSHLERGRGGGGYFFFLLFSCYMDFKYKTMT